MSKKIPAKIRAKIPAKIPAKISAKLESAGGQKYIFRLFVTGILPNSRRAVTNIKAICEQYLKGRYELEIVDIYQQPAMAVAEGIVAVPVLIKKFPFPEERMIGDMSDVQMVLAGASIV